MAIAMLVSLGTAGLIATMSARMWLVFMARRSKRPDLGEIRQFSLLPPNLPWEVRADIVLARIAWRVGGQFRLVAVLMCVGYVTAVACLAIGLFGQAVNR